MQKVKYLNISKGNIAQKSDTVTKDIFGQMNLKKGIM